MNRRHIGLVFGPKHYSYCFRFSHRIERAKVAKDTPCDE